MSQHIKRGAIIALCLILAIAFADAVHRHGGVRQAITAIIAGATQLDGNGGVR